MPGDYRLNVACLNVSQKAPIFRPFLPGVCADIVIDIPSDNAPASLLGDCLAVGALALNPKPRSFTIIRDPAINGGVHTSSSSVHRGCPNVTVGGTTSVLGTSSINTSGAAATNIGTGTYSGIVTIGTGGTGAVNIGNATGNTTFTGNVGIGTGPVYKLDVRGGITSLQANLGAQQWATAAIVQINVNNEAESETTPNRGMRLLQYESGTGAYGGGISWGMAPQSNSTWLSGQFSSAQYLLAYDGNSLSLQGSNANGGATPQTITPTTFVTFTNAGQVQFPVQGSTGGLLIGTDANLYRSAANTLKTDDSLSVWGNLGVGVDANAAYQLDVQDTNTVTSGTNVMNFNNFAAAPVGAGSGSYYGNETVSTYTGTGSTTGVLTGIFSWARQNAGAGVNVGAIYGLYGEAQAQNAGTTSWLIGTRGEAGNTAASTGTVGNAIGLQAFVANNSTAGAVFTAAYGLSVATPIASATGTITTVSGVYIYAQAGTGIGTAYGINQQGASDLNYFAGNTGIGTAATAATALSIVDTKGSATGVEEYGQTLSTTYSVADTQYKQGLRLNTSATNTSGTLTSLVGLLSLNTSSGSGGTTTSSFNLWTRNDAATGATVTSSYDLFINNGSGAGTIQNQYGVYVSTLGKGTVSNYGIYQQGASDLNYFAGNVGIGTTTATGTDKFVVFGNTNINTDITAATTNIGTGAAAETVSIGSSNTTSITSIDAGTGGLSIGDSAVANTIQIGNTTGAVTQIINIGTNATASSVTTLSIGSTIGASVVTLHGGASGFIHVDTPAMLFDTGGPIIRAGASNTANSVLLFNTSTGSIQLGGTAAKVNIGPAGGSATPTLLFPGLDTASGLGADPTESDGAMFYSSGNDSFRCGEAGVWTDCAILDIQSAFVIQDEFTHCGTTSGTIGDLGWGATAGTGGADTMTCDGLAPAVNHPGTFRMATTAVINTGETLNLGNAGGNDMLLTQDMIFRAGIDTETVTNTVVQVGLFNTAANAGVWTQLIASQSANWKYCYANSTNTTVCTTSATVATTGWHHFEIDVTGGGTSPNAVSWYVDGTLIGSISATAVSSNAVAPIIHNGTQTTAVSTLDIDYVQVRGVTSAKR